MLTRKIQKFQSPKSGRRGVLLFCWIFSDEWFFAIWLLQTFGDYNTFQRPFYTQYCANNFRSRSLQRDFSENSPLVLPESKALFWRVEEETM